jgi:FKBP-type peptidyl-prolyl cis-trans isomerase SlyD
LKTIHAGCIVSLEVEMHDAQDELIHSSEAPLVYLHGGYGGVFEGIERALEGKAVGDTVHVQLEPEDAFGDYDAELVRVEPLARYGEGLIAGMEIEDAFDGEEPRMYQVTDVAEGKVVLDGNHPLSGLALRFTCKVVAIRAATPEEVEKGRVEDEAEDGSEDD